MQALGLLELVSIAKHPRGSGCDQAPAGCASHSSCMQRLTLSMNSGICCAAAGGTPWCALIPPLPPQLLPLLPSLPPLALLPLAARRAGLLGGFRVGEPTGEATAGRIARAAAAC